MLARLAAPLTAALVAFVLTWSRLLPGVAFWDTAELQVVAPVMGTAHPTGFPTYVILGWLASFVLAPFGEAAFRMNLLSAMFVGIAAGVTVDLTRRLAGSMFVGVVAGLGLAATPIVWRIATHADPHALHLTFVAILVWLLVRWEEARRSGPDRADRWLLAAAVVSGLSAGNHSLTLLLALPIALYVLAVEPAIVGRGRFFVACALAVIVPTILVYLQLPLRGGAIPGLEADLVYGSPDTLAGFAYVVTGEQFRGGINDPFGNLPGKVADLAGLAASEVGALAILVPVGLFVTAVRFPAYALLTGTTLAITCFFNAAYVNADIERYYLGPALVAWTWLAILAATVVDGIAGTSPIEDEPAGGEPPPRRLLALIDPVRLTASALAAALLIAPTVVAFPDRAAAVDRTTDRSAELWLDDLLASLEPNAVVVSWWSYSTSLWYAQHIQGRRLDVFVADDRTRLDLDMGDLTDVIDRYLAEGRPVYVIRIDTGELRTLRERYSLVPLLSPIARNVMRVLPPAAGIGR